MPRELIMRAALFQRSMRSLTFWASTRTHSPLKRIRPSPLLSSSSSSSGVRSLPSSVAETENFNRVERERPEEWTAFSPSAVSAVTFT